MSAPTRTKPDIKTRPRIAPQPEPQWYPNREICPDQIKKITGV